MREYAIAGTLHLDHFATLVHSPADAYALSLNVSQLSRALRLPGTEVRARLRRLLTQHETEWKAFVHSLGPRSFVTAWASQVR
jgi:hypothetical protein